MRKIFAGIFVLLIIAGGYMAWPFWSALQLRLAVEAGDKATIERKVDWGALRKSLKASLLLNVTPANYRHALAPNIQTGTVTKRGTSAQPRPGLWQRIKTGFASSVIDRTVDKMVTPEGLAGLFNTRQDFHHKLKPAVGYEKPKRAFENTWLAGGTIARYADKIDPVHRIVFTSLTQVEVEMSDRYNPKQHFVTVLQLKDYDWKLVGLRIVPADG